jgi:hypothetical protein
VVQVFIRTNIGSEETSVMARESSARNTVSRPSHRAWSIPVLLASALCAASAYATPARIIVLRHGEKQDAWRLCAAGQARAAALVSSYLGKNSANSLFGSDAPAAFIAITPHTLELATPAAASWGLPVTIYPVLPAPPLDKAAEIGLLNLQTRNAAADVLIDPRWAGKTVVMVWEHHHIADATLAQEYSPQSVTLRQLFGPGGLPDVPATWPGGNYDYFWIVDYAGGSDTPTSFRMQKQVFPASAGVPENDWGVESALPPGCID